jgi:polysaccharide export outer membrane protein
MQFSANKISKYLILFVLGCIVLNAEPAMSGSYKIGADDVMSISVYDQPDLSKTVRVSSEGYVALPLLGNVKVEGLTVKELKSSVEEKLAADYLVNPQVSIFITEYRSRKIYMLGELSRPGVQELTGNTTLLEAISKAGGVTKNAGKTAIISKPSHSTKDGQTENVPLKISLEKLLDEGDSSLNIDLSEGSVVHISKANSFFVLGEVKKPGSFIIKKGTTVLQAITMAGGFTKIAAPARTKVIRVVNGHEETIKINLKAITKGGDKSLDIPVESDDIIVVPESFF